jgi:hypothetical protein
MACQYKEDGFLVRKVRVGVDGRLKLDTGNLTKSHSGEDRQLKTPLGAGSIAQVTTQGSGWVLREGKIKGPPFPATSCHNS